MKPIGPVISSNFSIFLKRAFIRSPHSSRSSAGLAWLSKNISRIFHSISNQRLWIIISYELWLVTHLWFMTHDRWWLSLLVAKLSATYWAKAFKVSPKLSGVLLYPSGLLLPLIPIQIVPQLFRMPDVLGIKLHLLLSAKLLHSLMAQN